MQRPRSAEGQLAQCLSWVNNGLSWPTPGTSGVGGKADVNSAKSDIGQRMSPVGG
jgi:hypothetical protein